MSVYVCTCKSVHLNPTNYSFLTLFPPPLAFNLSTAAAILLLPLCAFALGANAPAPTLPVKYLVIFVCVPSASRRFISRITGTSTSSVRSCDHPIVAMRKARRPGKSSTPHWKGSVA